MEAWSTDFTNHAGGTMQRSIACVDGRGAQQAASGCPGVRPISQASCNVQPCDTCAGNTCSGLGPCSGGSCQCPAGMTGRLCEVS